MSYLVLHVRPFDFSGEDGRQISGSSITYVDLRAEQEPGELGRPPLTISVTTQAASAFRQVPGLYELDFRQRRGKAGKPVLTLAGGELKQAVKFDSLVTRKESQI